MFMKQFFQGIGVIGILWGTWIFTANLAAFSQIVGIFVILFSILIAAVGSLIK